MKFSIVTPSNNSERFIRETIESVVGQEGAFNIEYIIVDNCSHDRTIEIVKAYQVELLKGSRPIHCNDVTINLVSTKKNIGMYEALNMGFSLATGDIMAWINADDRYAHEVFDNIHKVFLKYPNILWLKGITSYIDEASNIYEAGKCHLYQQEWIKSGYYGPVLHFIQQDSVFWQSSLWHKADGLNSNLELAGDYFLWCNFAKHVPLYSINSQISFFRRVEGQRCENIEAYYQEIECSGGMRLSRWHRERMYRKLERLSSFFRTPFFQRLFFGSRNFYLITLDENDEPNLVEGTFDKVARIL